jgi:hypothetical protein
MSHASEFEQAFNDQLTTRVAEVDEIVRRAIADARGKRNRAVAHVPGRLIGGDMGETVLDAIIEKYTSAAEGWSMQREDAGPIVRLVLTPKRP